MDLDQAEGDVFPYRQAVEEGRALEGPRADVVAGRVVREAERERVAPHQPVWIPNLQPDFNVSVIERFGPDSFAVLRELDKSNRFVQKSAESTSI